MSKIAMLIIQLAPTCETHIVIIARVYNFPFALSTVDLSLAKWQSRVHPSRTLAAKATHGSARTAHLQRTRRAQVN